MKSSVPSAVAATLLAIVACSACHGASSPAPVVAAEARMADARATAVSRTDTVRRGYTAADVRFMQHMIAHHAQALAIVALVPARTSRDDIRLLAERIDVSQKTEIAMMQRWLRERGETVPDADATPTHSMAGHDMAAMSMAPPTPSRSTEMPVDGVAMPGMLTPSRMDALAKASGNAFNQLFLEGMIEHHEGALTMVAALFASRGAGQEPEIFRFASDVDADQRAEIARMRGLLGPSAPGTQRPR